MEPTIEQIIEERFDKLPKYVQDYISDPDFKNVVRNIIGKYNLHIDVQGKIEAELVMLLLGVTEPKDFHTNLLREAGLESSVATALTKDINENIFMKIKESATQRPQLHNELPARETVPSPAPAPQPAEYMVAKESQEPINTPQEEVPEPLPNIGEVKHIEKKYVIDPYREPIE